MDIIIIVMAFACIVYAAIGLDASISVSRLLGRVADQETYRTSWRATNAIIFLLIWCISLSIYAGAK